MAGFDSPSPSTPGVQMAGSATLASTAYPRRIETKTSRLGLESTPGQRAVIRFCKCLITVNLSTQVFLVAPFVAQKLGFPPIDPSVSATVIGPTT